LSGTVGFLAGKAFLVYISNVYDNLPSDEVAAIRGRVYLVQARSFVPGAAADEIAARFGLRRSELAQLTQRLLRIGPELLAESLPEKFADAIQLAEGAEIPHHEAERQTLGAPHAAVGAYLLGLWGLPETVVEAVAWHHEPARCPATRLGVVGIVHAADAIEHLAHPADAVGRVTAVDQAYLESLGLAWQYPAWKAAWQDMSGEGQGRGLAARL
jgi:hypothetical protein